MKSPDGYEVFVLFRNKEKIPVTWGKSFYHFGQLIQYIGVTDGLGGYQNMLKQGFKDRRDFKPLFKQLSIFIRKNKLYLHHTCRSINNCTCGRSAETLHV